jgi:hypothetical protein
MDILAYAVPLVGTVPLVWAGQATAAHMAAASVPVKHEDVPETAYPAPHVGWQADPDASALVQVPAPPLAGAVDASHGHAATVLVK